MKSFSLFGKAHEAQAGGDFVWFVYGSSLQRGAFAAWADQHGYQPPDLRQAVPCRLDGYRLAFDVVSRSWGGAVASLAESPGDHVEGLAMPMPGSARGLVDHKEGAVSGLYEPFEVELTPLAGGPASKAIAYRSAAARRLSADAAPSLTYLGVLIQGARECGLSQAWVERLARLAEAAPASVPDAP
jgi:hypothetical protein